MTNDEKLAAILAAVQTDPGNRGLARDPHDNLFTATAGDFQKSCMLLAHTEGCQIWLKTGFYIPRAHAFETDGPLGALFLIRAWFPTLAFEYSSEREVSNSIEAGIRHSISNFHYPLTRFAKTAYVMIERTGPAIDGRYYTMKGTDTSPYINIADSHYETNQLSSFSIGIGDGGNEIGMGKIPHETIVKNIPNGDLIHCRVPTDHLIVAGVSNWGAYALAAGLFVLKGVTPPPDLFDPDREREILEVMVKAGPLVDGVTGEQTATVDGLTWDEYVKPLIRIRDILNS
jgi:hypothetical protein